MDVLAFAFESARTVWHKTLSLGSANCMYGEACKGPGKLSNMDLVCTFATQISLSALAEFAFFAF
jgi:hypothetical protein